MLLGHSEWDWGIADGIGASLGCCRWYWEIVGGVEVLVVVYDVADGAGWC